MQIIAATLAGVLIVAFLVVQHFHAERARSLAAATEKTSAAPPRVVVVTAERPTGTSSLTLPGETAAWYQSTIYARVNGYVAKWSADIGDRVKKGEVMAVIETPDLDADLAAAQAKFKSANAQVKVREAEAQFAKTTYDRWRDSPKGVVSDQERESKKADFNSAAARLNAAIADVNADQSAIDRLLALTQYKQVTAPFDGIVTERRIDIGNLVTAGSTAATMPLYRVTQDDPLRVFIDVPQDAAETMKDGAAVTVAAKGEEFPGKIARTANAIDPQSRTLRVEVDLSNPKGALVPGMYVEARFSLPSEGTVEVPAAALMFRAKGPQVAIVDNEGEVRFSDVAIARDDGNTVELASGLEPGQRVILNVSNEIASGERVTVFEPNQSQGLAEAAATKALR